MPAYINFCENHKALDSKSLNNKVIKFPFVTVVDMVDSSLMKIANMELDLHNNLAVLRLSYGIFSVEDAEQAIDCMIEKASARLITDNSIFRLELKPKAGFNLEEAGWEFNNLLVNKALQRLKMRKSNPADAGHDDEIVHEIERNLKELELESMGDPLGISKLWDEA